MSSIHFISTILLLLVVSVSVLTLSSSAVTVYLPTGVRQAPKNTFERCSSDSECRDDLTCLEFDFESGLKGSCPEENDGIECFCLSGGGPIQCDEATGDQPCPTGETCTQSPRGSLFCVGCKAVKQLDGYNPINKTACKSSSNPDDPPSPVPATPSVSPRPLGRIGDFCSIREPCRDGLKCKDEEVLCLRFSVICTCVPKKRNAGTNCVSKNDCGDQLETCVKNMALNQTYCASCDLAFNSREHQIVGNDQEIEDFQQTCSQFGADLQRPLPYYPESPNGFTLDTCTSDLQCRGSLGCYNYLSEVGLTACSLTVPCVCIDPDLRFKNCKNSNQCPRGEVCSRAGPNAKVWNGTKCISFVYDMENLPLDVQVLPPAPKYKSGAIGDQCEGELDCREDLACTHPDDAYGGCAGRRGCSCQPARFSACQSNSDCVWNTEICVNVPGANSKPYCKSKKNLLKNSYFEKPIAQLSSKPTPTKFPTNGWISDACDTDDDCITDDKYERVCMHVLERFGTCDGRSMCVCKAIASPKAGSDPNSEPERKSIKSQCESSIMCGSGESCCAFLDSLNDYGECISTLLAEGPYSAAYTLVGSPRPSPTMSRSPGPEITVDVSASPMPSSSNSIVADPTSTPEPTESSDSSQTSPNDATPTIGDPSDAPMDPDSSPGLESVCIDSNLLSHLPRDSLVFRTHRKARVLCDASGSCATPGHIVEYRGKAMMMRTYCEDHSSCTRNVRFVNSPKMTVSHRSVTKRNPARMTSLFIRIESRTANLHFTPFSARFETSFEERLLQTLTRFGL